VCVCTTLQTVKAYGILLVELGAILFHRSHSLVVNNVFIRQNSQSTYRFCRIEFFAPWGCIMEPVFQWGLDFITAVQQLHGPVLDTFFKAITFMGEEEFFLLFIPVLFWCVDLKCGARVALMFLASAYLNVNLKQIFMEPRPFELDPSVKLQHAEGLGMPSGHAQSSIAVWGTVAARFKRRWFWLVAALLALFIGFSRVYLGVHFPTQVLAGWAVGGLMLALFLGLHRPVERWFGELRTSRQLTIALVGPAVLATIVPSNDSVASMSVLSGFATGLVLARCCLILGRPGQVWQRVVSFLVGAVVMLGIYLGLKAIFPGEEDPLYLFFRYSRYGLVGLWISLGAPWLFGRLHLVADGPSQPQARPA
jgi:membrane-associated phospholipid phosphatase